MNTYRVGVIGCGRIASLMEDSSKVHPVTIAGAFDSLPNTKLVAAANRGEEKLRAFGERWRVNALYHDYQEMLNKEELDIVCVATHPPLHAEMVVAATEAGAKGIFCEKPMALNLAECDTMIKACEQAGTKMLINCTRRWSGHYEAVKRLIEEETLGELLHIVSHCQGCKPFPAWQAEHEGPLLHDTVHTFDILRFFAGDVEWVLATATRRTDQFRVEDTSYSIMNFSNGVTGVVVVDELVEYERWDVELQFTKGKVYIGPKLELWTSKQADMAEEWWCELVPGEFPKPAWTEPSIKVAAQDLVSAIEQDRECRCTGYDGRASIEIIMAIYESERRSNTKVRLPLGVSESVLEIMRREGKF